MAKGMQWNWEAQLGDQETRFRELIEIKDKLYEQTAAADKEFEDIVKAAKARAKAVGEHVRLLKL